MNSKGVSADDGEAVLILAKEYGFKCEGTFTGEFFKNSTNYRPEANSRLIVVITTEGDTAGNQSSAGPLGDLAEVRRAKF